MDRAYAGAQSGVGAVYEWSGSLKAGAGRMEIVGAVDDERVMIDQRNRKPFRSESSYDRSRSTTRSTARPSRGPYRDRWR